jgi:hypothetical protein
MNTIIIIMSENTESKNMSWADAIAIVQEEQGGQSPLLLAKQIEALYKQLDDKIEQLDDLLEEDTTPYYVNASFKESLLSIIDWGHECYAWSETIGQKVGQ